MSLQDRLRLAEEDFLCALSGGDDALLGFDERWRKLINDLDSAMESYGLDTETSMLAHAISLRISILADTSAELVESYNSFTTQLMDQMTGLMVDLTLEDRISEFCRTSSPSRPCFALPNTASLPPVGVLHHLPDIEPCRKRRRDAPELDPSVEVGRGMCEQSPKRRCVKRVNRRTPVIGPLPKASVPISVDEVHLPISRKRRLSDTDIVSPLHRLKRSHTGPRLYAVSDSFPLLRATEGKTIDPVVSLDIQPFVPGLYPGDSSDSCCLIDPLPNAMDSISHPELKDLDDFFRSCLDHPPLDSSFVTVGATLKFDHEDYTRDENGAVANSPGPSSPSSISSCPSTPPMDDLLALAPHTYGSLTPCVNVDSCDDLYPSCSSPIDISTSKPHSAKSPPSFLDYVRLGNEPAEWGDLLDPLDPFVWLSAPPPYSGDLSLLPGYAQFSTDGYHICATSSSPQVVVKAPPTL